MKKYIGIMLFAVLAASCTSDYEKFNTNPNKQSYGSVGAMAMLEDITVAGSQSLMSRTREWGNQIAQMNCATGSGPRLEHCYKLESQYNSMWNHCFLTAANARHMYQLAEKQGDNNAMAIALTMKVYYMSILTDLYGDIPYQEALRGAEGIIRPVVESQKSVYEGMMADLETANSLYKLNNVLADATKDKMFAGDIAKWQKFTNTLHMRLLNRVSLRNEEFSPSVAERMAAIVGDPAKYPVMTSNDDNAMIRFDGSAIYYRNVLNQYDITTDNGFSGDHLVSEHIIGLMVYNDKNQQDVDPRLKIWCTPRYRTGSSSIVWNWQGSKPGCVQSYGAEPSVYNEALRASCKKWAPWGANGRFPVMDGSGVAFTNVTITDQQIENLIARPEVRWDGTFKRLAEQKWLALWWNIGFDPYSEMRRTGYPECTINEGIVKQGFSINSEGKAVFIARCSYPQIAIANNRANYMVALERMGTTTNDIVTPVWWSGQAVAKDAGQPWPHSFRTLTYQE